MSTNPSPELKSFFEAALNEFETRTGTNLVQHQVIDKLVNCRSADSVIDVLQEQAQAFRNFRGDDGRVMTWIKKTVNVLHSLSTSGVLGEGIGLVCHYSFPLTRMHHRNTISLQPFPPAKAIFAGINILLEVCVLIGYSSDILFIPPGYQRCQQELRCHPRAFRIFRIFPEAPRHLYEDPIYHCDDRDYPKDLSRTALYHLPCNSTGQTRATE
jgi:hypothetical protein